MNNQNPTKKTGFDGDEKTVRNDLELAKSGDEKAYSRLFVRYDPLIRSLAAKYRSDEMSDADEDDLLQEAKVSFCRAVQTFRTGQADVNFGLYAKVCMENRLISSLREWKRKKFLPDGIPGTESEASPDPTTDVIAEEQFQALLRMIKETLTEYENTVWWSYMAGKTAGEIASDLGTSEKSVTNAVYRIRKKLRAMFSSRS